MTDKERRGKFLVLEFFKSTGTGGCIEKDKNLGEV